MWYGETTQAANVEEDIFNALATRRVSNVMIIIPYTSFPFVIN